MRAVALAAFAVAALALPAPAAAKELIQAMLCGPTVCRTLNDATELRALPQGGQSEEPLGPPAPYYRLTFVAGDDVNQHSFELYYVPSANSLAAATSDGGQLRIYGRSATSAMRRFAAGLEPFPIPHVTSVSVGDRTVTGSAAQTYLRLFSEPATIGGTAQAREWIRIDLDSAQRSPWTDSTLQYSPDDDALVRGWEVVELPAALAADIEAGRALDPSDRGLPWRTVGLSALAALALAGLTWKKAALPSVLTRWPQGDKPRLRGS